ncbi:MAG: hypothetical protein ACQESO_00450 [Bacillota bacterium]
MKGIKLFILIILFLLLVPLCWVFQASLTAELTVLNSTYYEDLLTETELTSYLHELLHDRFLVNISEQMPETLAKVVTEILMFVFDEDWLEEQILYITDDLLLYVKGDQPAVQAVIDLRVKKEQIRSNLETALNLLPDQLLAMLGFDPQAIGDLTEMLVDNMPLPNRIAAKDILSEEGEHGNLMTSLIKVRQYRSLYTYLTYAALILLILFNYLLAGVAGAFKWFGAAVLVSGISFFLVLQAVLMFLMAPLTDALETGGLLQPDIFATVIEFSATRTTFIPVYFSLAGLVIVLSGILAGRLVKRNTI